MPRGRGCGRPSWHLATQRRETGVHAMSSGPSPSREDIRCCIAGCGPAGAMLGLLLARAGVPVVVLEKHADFLRDFRGDTMHPSTLEILAELGLADRFLSELPHSEVRELKMRLPNGLDMSVDFRR